MEKRTGPHKKALQIVKYFRHEDPDYNYLRSVFSHLRKELDVPVKAAPKKLPYVPTEDEIKKYYEAVWQTKNMQDMLIIKTLLFRTAAIIIAAPPLSPYRPWLRRCG